MEKENALMKWWLDKVYYPIWRFWKWNVLDIPYNVRNRWQLNRKGYCDRDIIGGIDDWFTDKVPKMIRELSEHLCGCPEEFMNKEGDWDCDKWKVKLLEIADNLEQWKYITDLKHDYNPEWKALDDKRNLRWNFSDTDRPEIRQMNFVTDLTEAEDKRYWELHKELEAECYRKWGQGMDDFKKYFGHLWD